MSELPVLKESEHSEPGKQSKHSEAQSRLFHISLARYLSRVLSPVGVSLPVIVLVAFYHASSIALALLYTLITLFFLSFGPMVYIVTGVRRGEFTDVDVSLRTQRVKPFLFVISSTLLGLAALIALRAP